ncbi:ferrous iron transport protein B [Desulfuromonas acetoxidans]|uniref:Ferrous iron transport protein B n=1 Tax=Desulfuromonas acetoxidans (strain DSM 684 / 11070) TaxID=281689 RepID=Q1K3M5_DESA6|nr:ferrous iron transport protein B [Desulfuromonas acetoxidans]EAT16949.1 ferrous iron transport protein B [Desulfuromonas acetoxidans DSM 684]MBF0644521.1 ferrous iron transport protein B [Desulfuromonas acetoxidans]NVD23952.1 ferrous iron transport protein B [Desulfuromonas acetoxidans]NVE16249.1 ferrous iron transport protein B [Desulfuromonas acetoxidans]
MQSCHVAFAGNPNAGKTTLFNNVTGSRQHVGNYPGITVERKEGRLIHQETELNIVDLPGCYSLTAYTQEELVARQVLVEERPELVVNVVDATKLERHLYLTIQFMELGAPILLALNMMDDVRNKGMSIDLKKLAKGMGCPVVGTVARSGEGKPELLDRIIEAAEDQSTWQPLQISYGPDIDPVLETLITAIEQHQFLTQRYPSRWLAIKYLEDDEQIIEQGRKENPSIADELNSIVENLRDHCAKTLNSFPEAIIADYRYGFIHSLLKRGIVTYPEDVERMDLTDNLDKVLTHKVFGPALMMILLYLMFQITFTLGDYPLQALEFLFSWLGRTVGGWLPDGGYLQSLVVSGVIDGVGGVLSFVPLIVIMFIMIAFLEDCGYMARVAYMMDKIFRTFGLHGSSVMPFIISGGIAGGCAVPGVMAARTLRSPREKLATILTAPFMPCGAKIPVFLLLIGAFFAEYRPLIMFGITLTAWAMALLVARLLRSTLIRGESTPFVMELPPYRWPTLQGILIHTWERTWEYIKKAGTVILAISILLWLAMTFPRPDHTQTESFNLQRSQLQQQLRHANTTEQVAQLEGQLTEISRRQSLEALKSSAAGQLGKMLEPISSWAGFNWRTNIALIGGVAAKEVIVSTLGTAYSLGEVDSDEPTSLIDRIAKDNDWNRISAISAILFVLLYAPCFVTIVVMARETSWRWACFALFFNTAIAFGLATLVYQTGLRLF